MKDIFNDYRCPCKKLLFKGFIFVGEVEIRCRFCKRTSLISGLSGGLSNKFRYVLVTDEHGKILKTTSSAELILGYTEQEIKSKLVHEILSSLSPKHYSKIWAELDSNLSKTLLFKGEETLKDTTVSNVQVGVRALTSQADGKKLFVFDVNRKVPQELKKLTFHTTKKA